MYPLLNHDFNVDWFYSYMTELKGSMLSDVIEGLRSAVSSLYESDRIVATAFYGQVRHFYSHSPFLR